MSAYFVCGAALAFVLVQLAGCADPNVRERWSRDYRVTPEPPPTSVVLVRPPSSDGPLKKQAEVARPDPKYGDDARGTHLDVGRSTAVQVRPPSSDGLLKKQAEAARPDPKYGDDARGTRLDVGRSTVAPRSVSPGGSLVLSVQYTVFTANESASTKISETHALVIDNESVELRRQEVVRTQGSYTATAKVTLPATLSTGNYTLVTTISDGKVNKTVKTSFAVN